MKDLSESAFPSHRCFFLAAEKNARHGRAMPGLSVYVNTRFIKYVKRVCEDCKFGIFFSVDKQLFNTDKSIILAFIYLPPTNSHFYDNKPYRGIKRLSYSIYH